MFCQNCGKEIHDDAVICVHCGVPVKGRSLDRQSGEKDMKGVIFLILMTAFFMGFAGLHRFYTGHIVTGLIQLLTWGLLGIWQLIDLVSFLSGNFKDREGNPVRLN